jgi:DNA-binding LacI/PurR family transcriptional regulator
MEERHRGFADALAVHGITPKVVRSREFTIEAGHQVARDLRELRPRIDSIFAGSDLLAMGVIRGLIDLGQRIPEDVSVIGYDDIAIGASFIPPLTTIHQNWTDGGRLLARKALELVRGEAPASEMLPTFLVARGT